MKKIYFSAILMMAIALQGLSQVQFSVIANTQQELSAEARNQLDIKLAQILSRCSASTANADNPFGIESTIVVTESETAMMRTQVMTVTKGQLTLIVKNLKDGSQYYGNSYPLKVTEKAGKNSAAEGLIKGIRIDNPSFVRFVRVAREKVENFYKGKELPVPAADTVAVAVPDSTALPIKFDSISVQ